MNSSELQAKVLENINPVLLELMNAGHIKSLVDEAVKEAFFKDRAIREGYRDTVKPPLIVEMVVKELDVHVKEIIRDWLKDNRAEVFQILHEILMKGIIKSAISALDEKLFTTREEIINTLKAEIGQ